MKAKVTKSFSGVPDGMVHPQQINVGDIVFGDLAAAAVGQKWAEEVVERSPPEMKAAEPQKPHVERKHKGKS